MPLPNEFREMFSEEYRDQPWMEKYNSPDDFAKSYNEKDSYIGNSIRVPGPDAPAEDRQKFMEKIMNKAPDLMLKPDFSNPEQSTEFWATLGVPDEAGKYTVPEDVTMNEDVQKHLLGTFHKANLTPAQAQSVLKDFFEMDQATQQNLGEQRESDMSALKDEWGMTLENRTEAAKRMNDQFYPGRDFGSLTANEIKSLYEIHVATTGKSAPAAGQGHQPEGLTPQEADAQAEEMLRKAQSDEDLSPADRMKLIQKSIDLRKKYVPRYAEAS